MTEEHIERAGRILKIIRLAGMPGMDTVAIKLNCGLTYDELQVARRWARAFELAQHEGSVFEHAETLHEKLPTY
jgi:hypothetical protein